MFAQWGIALYQSSRSTGSSKTNAKAQDTNINWLLSSTYYRSQATVKTATARWRSLTKKILLKGMSLRSSFNNINRSLEFTNIGKDAFEFQIAQTNYSCSVSLYNSVFYFCKFYFIKKKKTWGGYWLQSYQARPSVWIWVATIITSDRVQPKPLAIRTLETINHKYMITITIPIPIPDPEKNCNPAPAPDLEKISIPYDQ